MGNVISEKGSDLNAIQSGKPPVPVHTGFANDISGDSRGQPNCAILGSQQS